MPKQLNVRISDPLFSALDDAVASGRFTSRAAALRSALELLLTDEPEAQEVAVTDAESAPDEVVEAVEAAQDREEGETPDGPDADEVAARVPVTLSGPEADDEEGVQQAVAAHPALVEQRVWSWAQERHLPVVAPRPALAFARRAVIPVLSGAAGALLATVVRGGVARRERIRPVRTAGDGPLHLLVVTRRG